jgi:hypothetical protein
MECFQGSYRFRENCVPCRKRVQRYSKFLNYKTFSEENFKEKLQLSFNLLNYSVFNHAQSFQQAFVKKTVENLIPYIINKKRGDHFFIKYSATAL